MRAALEKRVINMVHSFGLEGCAVAVGQICRHALGPKRDALLANYSCSF